MKKHSFILPTLLIGGTILISTTSYAADAVTSDEPTPPEATEVVPQQTGSWYIAARIGAAFADDTSFLSAGIQNSNIYKPGYTFSGALGYEFKTNSPLSFRTEMELGYLALEIDKQIITGAGTFSGSNASGTTSAFLGLANAYVDYELGTFTPFISAGLVTQL